MLDYNIHKFDRAIAFQITAQSDKYTNALKGQSFTASNGWTITKAEVPSLNVKSQTIYLRGTNVEKDLRVDRTWDLLSNYQRDKIVDQANKALSEFKVWVDWYKTIDTINGYLVAGSPSKPDTSGPNVAHGKVITG